jgi:hypothetical protein
MVYLLEASFRPAEVLPGSIQADFFLPSIALDFMHICHALDNGFLNPFVHLVFILIESVTAKDIAAGNQRSSAVHLVRCVGLILVGLVHAFESVCSGVV